MNSEKEELIKKLNALYTDFISTTLKSCISKESNIDTKLKSRTTTQVSYNNFIKGLSIIYLFAFMQTNLSKDWWKKIKKNSSLERENYPDIDWNEFDLFKYVRDCFAHSPDGTLFPISQTNTEQFIELLPYEHISTTDSVVTLDSKAVHKCFLLVSDVLEHGNTEEED